MLKISHISKSFATQFALKDANFEIRDGEFFSLLGPSGCGKTTLLRIIAGFETPTSGQLFWDDVLINGIKPQDRPFNMVFQKYALFPHLTVFENVAYGLQVRKVDRKVLIERVTEALHLVGLDEFHTRFPDTLSGGQAQRVALARAVVNKPKILLLDEPLSALDQKMREHMQTELRELQRRVGITFIFVTHDQEEAMALSDRIAVMNKGSIEQISTPEELYQNPKTLFVAQFIGASGALRGSLNSSLSDKTIELTTSIGQKLRGCAQGTLSNSAPAIAIVRPERIQVQYRGMKMGALTEGAPLNHVAGKIHSTIYRGSQRELQVQTNDSQTLRVFLSDKLNSQKFDLGADIDLHFSSDDTFIFPASE